MHSCILKFSDMIKCHVYKFHDYYYNKNDHYIYGTFNKSNQVSDSYSKQVYTTIDDETIIPFQYEDNFISQRLLSSLITLRQKLPTFNYCHDLSTVDSANIKQIEKQLLENKKSKKYINLILDWCRKNGMPFIGDINKHSFFSIATNIDDFSCYGFKNDFNYFLSNEKKNFKFRLGVFLIGLDILYTTFVLAISLNKEKLFDYDCTDYIDNYINTIPINRFNNISKDKKRDLINHNIRSMRIYIKSTFNSQNELVHYLYGDTLFSAAMYQLLLFIAYGNNKTSICKSCQKIYIHRRKNMLFCSDACRQAWHRHKPEK